MLHEPARLQRAVLRHARVGAFLPGIRRIHPLFPEKVVVAGGGVYGAVRVQPVVALERIEPAFGQLDADLRPGVDAEPLHAPCVRDHVGLADDHRGDADPAEMVAEGRLAHAQRKAVPGRAVRAAVAPGVGGHPRGAAEGRLHVGVGEPHTAPGEPVEVGRVEMRMAVAGQVVPAQLVGHDPEKRFRVGPFPVSDRRPLRRPALPPGSALVLSWNGNAPPRRSDVVRTLARPDRTSGSARRRTRPGSGPIAPSLYNRSRGGCQHEPGQRPPAAASGRASLPEGRPGARSPRRGGVRFAGSPVP